MLQQSLRFFASIFFIPYRFVVLEPPVNIHTCNIVYASIAPSYDVSEETQRTRLSYMKSTKAIISVSNVWKLASVSASFILYLFSRMICQTTPSEYIACGWDGVFSIKGERNVQAGTIVVSDSYHHQFFVLLHRIYIASNVGNRQLLCNDFHVKKLSRSF